MKIYKRLLAVLFVMLVMLCGCSAQKGDSEKNEPNGLDAEYKAIHEVTDIIDGRDDVYLILKSWGNSYWDSVLQGAIDAGNEIGCNVYAGGVLQEDNWQRQQALLEEAAENGAEAIVLAPVNAAQITETITELRKQGIFIVFVDTIIDTANFDVCYMTDNMNAGEIAAKEMISKLEAMGKDHNEKVYVAIQAGSTTSQTIIDRVAGFMSYWTTNAPENWKVLDDVKINDGDVELAVKYGNELISTYPELGGIFGCNNGSTVGSVNAIKESGKKDIVLVGFDFSTEMEEMLKSGEYSVSTIVQRQYNMSYLGVKQSVSGQTPDLKFVDTGITLVNQDNVFDDEIVKELEVSG